MNDRYIDFISAYCDRWCERCAYTSRCSAFAVIAATAMCGDFQEGLELAVGAPQPVEPTSPADIPCVDESESIETKAAELADSVQHEREGDARVHESSIMNVSLAGATLAHRWLSSRQAQTLDASDLVLKEAIEVASYDAALIAAKLYRALKGRDHAGHDDEEGIELDGQKDWNGSAKVALISLERSSAAWLTIARSTDDETPGEIASQLRNLQQAVERAFPDAWAFVRPGFDEIGR